jgi:hypothetical protein
MAGIANLPELFNVRMLWFSDWYDGPITGIATWEGDEYWFVMVPDDSPGGTWDFDPRVYVLHRLTLAQLSDAWAAHRAFAAAGVPGCLHDPPCPTGGGSPEALYERWPPDHEEVFAAAPAIGWFSD